VLIVSNNVGFVEECIAGTGGECIVLSNRKPTSSILSTPKIRYIRMPTSILPDIEVIPQIKEYIIALCAEGYIGPKDRVLCLFESALEGIVSIDMENLGLLSLHERVNDVDMRVLYEVISVAAEIGREGKEGMPTGALFIVGDSENVMKHSRQAIMNPFDRNNGYSVLNPDDRKTVKDYATLDGAMIIDDHGNLVAAGTYILTGKQYSIVLPDELGGRHYAAAYISIATRAVGVVLSSTGVIRIFDDGHEVYSFKVR